MTEARIARIFVILLCIASFHCGAMASRVERDAGQDTDIERGHDADVDDTLDSDRQDADSDAGTESSDLEDPLCFPGHDPTAPDLRVYGIDARIPRGLTEEMVMGSIQRLIEIDEISLILRFSEMTEDDGVLQVARGTSNGNGTYGLDPESIQGPFDIEINGNQFEIPYPGYEVVLSFETSELSFNIPVHETIIRGEFNTREHCSVGQAHEDGSERFENGVTMRGKVTVSDARSSMVHFSGFYIISVCAILAGTFMAPECDLDEGSWATPPDTDVHGEPAWTVDISFAASATTITDF